MLNFRRLNRINPMKPTFDSYKIANYLKRFKNDLPNLYYWNAKIDKLVTMGILTSEEVEYLNFVSPYDKELVLKDKVRKGLNLFYETDKEQFYKLCLWVVKDWGGIRAGRIDNTLAVINDFLKTDNPVFNRIASASKVGSYMFPEKNIIYDSRVAFSLNWIILSEEAGNLFFPIPEGRNSKMSAFDMNVLIRLKNIDNYIPNLTSELDNRQYIKQKDKVLFLPKNVAYGELIKLVQEVSKLLWDGEKHKLLYFTEMLLFSIADKEIVNDITERISTVII
jgi:hypothetical protein